MSRQFNGVTDLIDCAMGAIPPLGGGTTAVFLWRPLAVEGQHLFLTRDTVAGFNAWGVNPFSDGQVWRAFGATLPYAVAENWQVHAFAKPVGTAQPDVGHKYVWDTAAWSHTTLSAHGDAFGVVPNLARIGNDEGGGNGLNGRVAAIGVWDGLLSPEQVETLPSGLAAWAALAPAALWAFNQASTATPVQDLTGNGADQIGIVGTTVSADEPPGWSYSLTPAATRMVRVGGAWVPATRKVRESGLWVPV